MARARKIDGLTADQLLRSAIPRILKTRFEEMWSSLAETAAGTNVEALHDMRVSARRLQAALRISRDAFNRKKYARLMKVVRELLRHLGGVREHDVFLSYLEEYRHGVAEGDVRSIDFVIAREKTLRRTQQRALSRYLARLQRAGFDQTFLQFARGGV